MYTIFEADETVGVLLIDASNAFNALNRQEALHNIRVLAMGLKALNIQPLFTSLQGACKIKQWRFANDASVAVPVPEITEEVVGHLKCRSKGNICLLYTSPSPRDA